MSTRRDRDNRPVDSQTILNRLLVIEWYSLARYLMGASPWTCLEEASLLEVLRHMASDQQNEGVRIGRLLVRRYGYTESGQYPLEFMEYNDLAVDYLVQRLIEHESRMIDEITQCVQQLSGDAEAKQLAQEVLAREKIHLEQLTHLPFPASSPFEEKTETPLAVPRSDRLPWAQRATLSSANGIPPQPLR